MQVLVFKPSNEMTFDTVLKDRKGLIEYYAGQSSQSLVLDLAEVKSCDSAGLALLIEAKRLAQAENKRCELLNTPPCIRKLAEFCGLDGILHYVESHQALDMING